jgi:hypothetical protein
MRAFYLLGGGLAFVCLWSASGCVGDSTPITPDAGNDSSILDSSADVSADAPAEAEAGPPPCGYPGEDCCAAPLAPCNDGLACSSGNPKKCLVSEAWAVGSYSTQTSTALIQQIVTAHYDGSTWTVGKPVFESSDWANSYYPVDIYEHGTNVRVIANEKDVGYMYWWNGVSWANCGLGQSCVGPTMTTSVWAITSVDNGGSVDYWLAGSSTMYRCASGATSCSSVTNGITGSWGTGAFAGQTGQDLWYSVFDHVLHYDGTQWSATTVADAYTIGGVATNDVWIGQKQLRHWDGTSWSSAYLVEGSQTPGTVLSIGGSGPNDVHAVGNDLSQTSGSFAAHWDGTGWKLETLPSMSHVQKVWAPSPTEAFVVGGKATASNTGVIAHWDGTSWTEMPSPTVTYTGETTTGGLVWVAVTGQARPRSN